MGPMIVTACVVVMLMALTDLVVRRLGLDAQPPRARERRGSKRSGVG